MACVKEVEGPRLVTRRWEDGNEQIIFRTIWDERDTGETDEKGFIAIERVVAPNSRRKRWRVVVRADEDGNSLYPPAISPPCKNVWEAMRLCRTIAALRGWTV